MSQRSADNGRDRRRTPRVSCRLGGRVTRGRERIRVRIIDVSEGGLCLLAPVWLDPKQPVEVEIEVPGRATAKIRAEIWHIRREKSRLGAQKVWIAGAILRDGDAAYAQLLQAVGLTKAGAGPTAATAAPSMAPTKQPSTPSRPTTSTTTPATANANATSISGSGSTSNARASVSTAPAAPAAPAAPTASTDPTADIESIELRVFRLHCKAKGVPRTRVLTLAAESEEEARKLAEADLGRDWDLLEVREV
ncbi:MAG: PilZ domain-containing protein [Myxococcota bacterium]